jgi:hypothetical protein
MNRKRFRLEYTMLLLKHRRQSWNRAEDEDQNTKDESIWP